MLQTLLLPAEHFRLDIKPAFILLTTMVVNNITSMLSELGFSDYEGSAYTALLAKHPSTAYETAKEAGIPTSKIYGTLDRLASKGAVSVSVENGKKLFIPRKASELIAEKRQNINSTLDLLEDELSKIKAPSETAQMWVIRDRAALMDKAGSMISASSKSVLLSAWDNELTALSTQLLECRSRKVRLSTVHFGDTAVEAGQMFSHPISDTIHNEKGGRGFTLVRDSTEALVATISEDGSAEGLWSGNSGFVTLAEDYIKHDIYIMKIVRRFDAMLESKFGKKYKLLRNVFADREVK